MDGLLCQTADLPFTLQFCTEYYCCIVKICLSAICRSFQILPISHYIFHNVTIFCTIDAHSILFQFRLRMCEIQVKSRNTLHLNPERKSRRTESFYRKHEQMFFPICRQPSSTVRTHNRKSVAHPIVSHQKNVAHERPAFSDAG